MTYHCAWTSTCVRICLHVVTVPTMTYRCAWMSTCTWVCVCAVSYTHLDVYKRQVCVCVCVCTCTRTCMFLSMCACSYISLLNIFFISLELSSSMILYVQRNKFIYELWYFLLKCKYCATFNRSCMAWYDKVAREYLLCLHQLLFLNWTYQLSSDVHCS